MTNTAPAAPGKLGEAVNPQDAMKYLGLLGAWITQRRAELDELDEAILAAPDKTALTNDMVLSLSVWQAIKSRYDQLLQTWDSGRVGPEQLQRLSTLIWGRLDEVVPDAASPTAAAAQTAGVSVSLPEACRLSDALVGQLSAKLRRTPFSDQLAARLRDLRAQAERLRDQASLEPKETRAAVERQVADLGKRIDELGERLDRGGDIGGMIGPLEIEAATLERDLIVGNSVRREVRDRQQAASTMLASLREREKTLTDLVARVVATVTPAPKYAVPQVDSLGPVPASDAEVSAYLERLHQVNEAMQVVQDTYGRAQADYDAMTARLTEQQQRAASTGASQDAALDAIADTAAQFLARTPAPMPVVRQLLEAHATAMSLAGAPGRGAREGAPQ